MKLTTWFPDQDGGYYKAKEADKKFKALEQENRELKRIMERDAETMYEIDQEKNQLKVKINQLQQKLNTYRKKASDAMYDLDAWLDWCEEIAKLEQELKEQTEWAQEGKKWHKQLLEEIRKGGELGAKINALEQENRELKDHYTILEKAYSMTVKVIALIDRKFKPVSCAEVQKVVLDRDEWKLMAIESDLNDYVLLPKEPTEEIIKALIQEGKELAHLITMGTKKPQSHLTKKMLNIFTKPS